MKTISDVVRYVKENTNAIAYIPSSDIIDDKIIVLMEIK